MDFKKFAQLIMIEQTLFALPFAWMGILFAGGGSLNHWFWASLALFGARTAGMSFNRLLDADVDAKNPRTAERLLPKGEVTRFSVWILAGAASGLLVFSSYMLNSLCFYLSFFAIFLLFTYSFFKRFSASAHFYLGFVEAAAPIGGYLAISGVFELRAFLPGVAIMFWIAGLDILYSLQDQNFDRQEGLHSIPARYGRTKSLSISGLSYLAAVTALAAAGSMANLGAVYWVAVAAVAFIFIRQQVLSRTDGDELENSLGRIFYLNRFISPVLFLGMLLDAVLKNYFY